MLLCLTGLDYWNFQVKKKNCPIQFLFAICIKTNWDGGVGRPTPCACSERAMTVLLTFITERYLMRFFETPPTWVGCWYERWRKNMDGKNKLNQTALILFLWKETIGVTALEVTGIGKPICVVITEQVWTCIALKGWSFFFPRAASKLILIPWKAWVH